MAFRGRQRLFRRVGIATLVTLVVGAAVVSAIGLERIDEPATVTQLAVRVFDSAPPTTSGPLSSPNPTIEHLSVLWNTAGDANGNGRVTVRFRELGAVPWQPALPVASCTGGQQRGLCLVRPPCRQHLRAPAGDHL